MSGQIINQEAGERHLPAFVAFWGAPDLHASDERDRLGDGRTSAHQIEPADAQCGHLAEADAGIGEKKDDKAVRMTRIGE